MPAFNYERAAAALVDAAYTSDEEAATKHGVTARTIRNWRKRLDTDADFSAFFRLKKEAAERHWAEDINGAIRSTIDFLARAGREASPKDPEAIHAIAGAAKLLVEMEMTKQVLDARLADQNRPHPAQAGEMAARHRSFERDPGRRPAPEREP